jgi:hypothetical protein
MTQKQKLIDRLKGKPKNFTWDECTSLLRHLNYCVLKGPGSSRKFYNKETGHIITMHEPHPKKILKSYQVNLLLKNLTEMGVI